MDWIEHEQIRHVRVRREHRWRECSSRAVGQLKRWRWWLRSIIRRGQNLLSQKRRQESIHGLTTCVHGDAIHAAESIGNLIHCGTDLKTLPDVESHINKIVISARIQINDDHFTINGFMGNPFQVDPQRLR